jgi:predicted PurR-regulated permease PerM
MESTSTAQRALKSSVIAVAVVAVALVLWFAAEVFLLAFAGMLLAIFVRGLSRLLGRYLKLGYGISVIVTVLLLVSLLGLLGWQFGVSLSKQFQELSDELPKSIENLKNYIGHYAWGRELLEQLPKLIQSIQSSQIWTRAGGVFSTTVGAFANLLIVIATGLYFLAEPRLYVNGIVTLVPKAKRERAREVINAIEHQLWWWSIGMLISMSSIGLMTIIGLMILDIPLALSLGLLTGVLAFIPNFGPISSAIPPLLLGLMKSPQLALWVGGLYLLVQAIESNLITPMVQRRTVAMPPVLAIGMQLLLGILFGFLGLLLATPITVVLLVLVKALYIEDALGDVEPEVDAAAAPAPTK